MSHWSGWRPYVPVAERRRKALAAAAKAGKSGATLSPVAPSRGAIARTVWGKAWCDNLEHYSDFANRLPRGRTYVRNGSVIDLVITPGEVQARVMGSSLYRVQVTVVPVAAPHWKAIGADCVGSIDSMVELLQGRVSQAVMQRLSRPRDGLFPTPEEISFSCSCPDWASMCKHVAAVLYGVGARLDERPELLFDLRRVDGRDLLAQAGAGLAAPRKAPSASRVLDPTSLGDVFGLEMEAPAATSALRKADAPVRGKAAAAPAKPGAKTAASGAQRGAGAAKAGGKALSVESPPKRGATDMSPDKSTATSTAKATPRATGRTTKGGIATQAGTKAPARPKARPTAPKAPRPKRPTRP